MPITKVADRVTLKLLFFVHVLNRADVTIFLYFLWQTGEETNYTKQNTLTLLRSASSTCSSLDGFTSSWRLAGFIHHLDCDFFLWPFLLWWARSTLRVSSTKARAGRCMRQWMWLRMFVFYRRPSTVSRRMDVIHVSRLGQEWYCWL
jgi:hypothetical protein